MIDLQNDINQPKSIISSLELFVVLVSLVVVSCLPFITHLPFYWEFLLWVISQANHILISD